MSSPPQGLHEHPGLPPNPYAAPDDVTIQQWQRKAEVVRAILTLPGHAALPSSTSGCEAQPQFPSQELSPYGVENPHAERACMPEFIQDDIMPENSQKVYLDEFLRLNAQAYAQHTGGLEHPDGGIAFQTVQKSEHNNAQTITRYPQGLLDDDHLLTASVDDTSHAVSSFIWLADIHFPHPPSDGSESPLSMDPNSQPTFMSNIEHPVSAPDMSSILQSQAAAAAAAAAVSHDTQEVQRIRQRKRGWLLRVGRVVADICRLPTEQREKETMRFLACLRLSQPQQEAAFKIFVRMVERNKETTKWAPLLVFSKWLSLCVLDAQKRAKAARNDAVDVETVGKGTFCSEGIHKLKCGHECRSKQDCGMNCITLSAYPDTPLIDLRMSEIRCNECTAWL